MLLIAILFCCQRNIENSMQAHFDRVPCGVQHNSAIWIAGFRVIGPTRFRPNGTTGRNRFSTLSDRFFDRRQAPGAERYAHRRSSTVVPLEARERWMTRRVLTVDRHEEIKRRLADGRSLREIATALGCSRRLVRQIRDGERVTSPQPWPSLGVGCGSWLGGRSELPSCFTGADGGSLGNGCSATLFVF